MLSSKVSTGIKAQAKSAPKVRSHPFKQPPGDTPTATRDDVVISFNATAERNDDEVVMIIKVICFSVGRCAFFPGGWQGWMCFGREEKNKRIHIHSNVSQLTGEGTESHWAGSCTGPVSFRVLRDTMI